MHNATEVISNETMSRETRRMWATPSLRLLPIQESEGSTFSLASVDGTSSS